MEALLDFAPGANGDAFLLQGQGRLVQWYPGHIARAERRLKDQLGMVDVVLEVRDARCAACTCHFQLLSGLNSTPCQPS